VSGWSERIQVGDEDADFEAAVARVREPAERIGATQFETLTAAAFAEFAADGVDVAVVEAGLGGRLDATNVLDARVVALTNVSLDHTDVLGDSRDAIAREKLAVVAPRATVVLGEPEWEGLAHERLPARIVVAADVGRTAAAEFLGRELGGDVEIDLPGRLDLVGEDVFAGAHNPAGVDWLVRKLSRDYVICAAVLADKDARAMLASLRTRGSRFVATQADTERSLGADALAELAREFFDDVESVPDATDALARAHELAGPRGAVLVTGSLYLIRDLQARAKAVR
jgi:dihydrofolate synthase/folylpolyglutamate synthase